LNPPDPIGASEIAEARPLAPPDRIQSASAGRGRDLRWARTPALGAALLLYALAVCGTTAYSYLTARAGLIAEIDKDLLVAAHAVRYILPDDFHDRALNLQAVTPAEDRQNIEALTAYARDAELAFVFSVIAVDGEAVVTASSASPGEIAAGTEVLAFTPYAEANERLARALASPVPIAETYSDRWGSFRAVWVAQRSPGGRPYVAAAEIEDDVFREQLARTLTQSLLTALLLLLATIPAYLQINRGLRLSKTRLEQAVADRTRALERQATRDHLTGLGNRRAFSDAMELEVARARRHGGEFSLAILDLDRFKSINDGYGHEVGDRVLVAFADAAGEVLGESEVLARIGGEEFALLLPHASLEGAVRVAEGLRERVPGIAIDTPAGRLAGITVSIGVASSAEVGLDAEAVQRLADVRLYLAKAAGRDRVVAQGGIGAEDPRSSAGVG
jgi:diguanylate cyclase (GGDEF)-like protein